MKQDHAEEPGKQLRRQARREADKDRQEAAEAWTREAMQRADLTLLPQLEQHLELLGEAWAVHQKPLLSRIPVLGPFLSWLGTRITRFLLQHQITFNAEVKRTVQELYQAQRLLTEEQVARTDALLANLDERLLGLEARVRDLEQEVEQLRQLT